MVGGGISGESLSWHSGIGKCESRASSMKQALFAALPCRLCGAARRLERYVSPGANFSAGSQPRPNSEARHSY